jgi:hypothetical protein
MNRHLDSAPLALSALFALAALATSGCARIHQMDVGGVPVRSLAEITAEPATLEGLREGREDAAVVVHVGAGDRLPLRLRVALPAFHVEAGDNVLVFDREAYLYIAPGRMILLSPDGRRWAAPGDGRALRELFGARHGTFEVGFGVGREVGPFASVGLEARSD